MSKFKVIVTDDVNKPGLQALADRPDVDLVYSLKPAPETLAEILDGAAAWLVRSETKVTAEWIARAKSLRFIGRAGSGLDNIDAAAAKARGITVANAPQANSVAACEHAFGLMLALARNIPQACADLKSGAWTKSRWGGVELSGKTLGVVGLGRIGSELASRAKAFGMRVLARDPVLSADDVSKRGAEPRELPALLSESDFISLHAPMSAKTKNLLDRQAFAAMKPGARIINCARGELIEEAALIEALKSGRLAGAALDVFAQEPLPAGHPLTAFPNVILTPHLGASTKEAQKKAAEEIARRVLEFHEANPSR